MRATHLYQPSEAFGIPTEEVFQMLRMTCPLCHKDVQFAVHQDDKLYKEENEFLTRRIACQVEHIISLQKTIDKLTEIK